MGASADQLPGRGYFKPLPASCPAIPTPESSRINSTKPITPDSSDTNASGNVYVGCVRDPDLSHCAELRSDASEWLSDSAATDNPGILAESRSTSRCSSGPLFCSSSRMRTGRIPVSL